LFLCKDFIDTVAGRNYFWWGGFYTLVTHKWKHSDLGFIFHSLYIVFLSLTKFKPQTRI